MVASMHRIGGWICPQKAAPCRSSPGTTRSPSVCPASTNSTNNWLNCSIPFTTPWSDGRDSKSSARSWMDRALQLRRRAARPIPVPRGRDACCAAPALQNQDRRVPRGTERWSNRHVHQRSSLPSRLADFAHLRNGRALRSSPASKRRPVTCTERPLIWINASRSRRSGAHTL